MDLNALPPGMYTTNDVVRMVWQYAKELEVRINLLETQVDELEIKTCEHESIDSDNYCAVCAKRMVVQKLYEKGVIDP